MSKPKDITFHYTQPKMVEDLMKLLPLERDYKVLDAGSGKNKIWYKNIPIKCVASECEIEEGSNFYDWKENQDWVIGNPPYHESWKFTEKALTVAQRGIAWLLNNQALNSHLTPSRLQKMHDLGFHYSAIHVVADKRWFGRYYFLVLEKHPNGFITWNKNSY